MNRPRAPRLIKANYEECAGTVYRLVRCCEKCNHKNTVSCWHCPPQRVRNAILEVVRIGYLWMKDNGYILNPQDEEIDRSVPRTIKATYHECSETVRRLVRSCFTCKFKHSAQCKSCPPQRVRNALTEIIRAGFALLKEKGYIIQPRAYEKMDDSNLKVIFERRNNK